PAGFPTSFAASCTTTISRSRSAAAFGMLRRTSSTSAARSTEPRAPRPRKPSACRCSSRSTLRSSSKTGSTGAGREPTSSRPPPVRARWDLDGEPVVGFVGGYQPWHGIDALPALLERLLPRHPDVRLVVVGDGRGRREFERQIESRGLAAHVRVTGAVPHEDVPALIREFDVAVAPYPPPTHDFYFSPLKLFEYMGCAAAIAAP